MLSTSIVQFEIPDLIYKCSINPVGRRRFGTIDDLLISGTGRQSTVGIRGDNIEMTNIRNSTHFRSVIEFIMDSNKATTHIRELVPTDREEYVRWLPNDHKYDVIEYTQGGFFKEHSDAKTHKLHYATLLIFPPAIDYIEHTGGTLTIERDDKSLFIFETSKNTTWTFIAFHQHLKHRCDEVLSGRRIVIKTELLYNSSDALKNPDERDNIYHYYNDIVDGGSRYFM